MESESRIIDSVDHLEGETLLTTRGIFRFGDQIIEFIWDQDNDSEYIRIYVSCPRGSIILDRVVHGEKRESTIKEYIADEAKKKRSRFFALESAISLEVEKIVILRDFLNRILLWKQENPAKGS